MSTDGFLFSNSSDTTWIKPFGQEWKEVTYAAVGELAVFEGCVILGTVADMKAVKQLFADNPGLALPGAQPFGVGIRGVQYRWKNNTIPFEIDPTLPVPQRVTDAIEHWKNNTPMTFVKRDGTHQDHVVFRPGNGCASSVGRRGG